MRYFNLQSKDQTKISKIRISFYFEAHKRVEKGSKRANE